MSLVAYEGSSDEEDGDNEGQEDGGGKVILLPKTQAGRTSNGGSSDAVTFSKLPQPLDSGAIEEVQDEFLKKKEQPTEKPSKQPVKITLPSMAEFDSDDDDDGDNARKEAPKRAKASGLFALLPAPKGTPLSNKSFIPQVLTKKPKPQPKKKLQPKPARPPANEDSGESDVDMDDLPETFDEETWKKVCAPNKKPQKRTIEEIPIDEATSSGIEIAPDAAKPYDGLDNEAFKQLVGSSKRRRENIKLIDINEEEVTADKDLWITKSLTDPEMVPKQQAEEDEETINNTQRRKHHITYLAQQVFTSLFSCWCFSLILFCLFQAKANEQELQSQWASNKYKKSLTRSKYGF